MSGRSSRVKGASGERELAALLSDLLGRVVKRRLGQSREGGHDLTCEKFIWEVKRQEAVHIHAWCKQAEAAAKPGEVPVVCFRRSRDSWRVVLRLEDFIPLLRGELTGGVGDGNSNGGGGERGINQLGDDQDTAGQTERGAGKALGAGLLGAGGDGKGTDVTS